MSINMNQWAKGLIESKKRLALPIMTYPGLSITGGTVGDFVKSGDKQFECIAALTRRYNPVAIVGAMDLSVEAEAFGCPIRFSESEVPAVTDRIVLDEDTAHELAIPAMDTGRMNEYLKANTLCSREFPDTPVLGGMIGPFSLAARLMDMTEIMINIMIEPEMVEEVLHKTTDFLIEYARAIRASGASGVIVAEPAAGLLSPDQCAEFSSVYMKKIVDAVQDENFMVILHNCGKTRLIVDSMVSTGAAGLHFGNAVDMTDILPQVPASILVLGNIDPAGILKGGTPESVKQATAELLAKTAEYANFIPSSGCDIPPGTPIENIDAFFEAIDEYNHKL